MYSPPPSTSNKSYSQCMLSCSQGSNAIRSFVKPCIRSSKSNSRQPHQKSKGHQLNQQNHSRSKPYSHQDTTTYMGLIATERKTNTNQGTTLCHQAVNLGRAENVSTARRKDTMQDNAAPGRKNTNKKKQRLGHSQSAIATGSKYWNNRTH